MLVCRNVDWFGFLDCCWTYYLEGEVMDVQKIKELALANGFSLKEQASGNMDLHSYVYEFANAIEQAVKTQAVPEWISVKDKLPGFNQSVLSCDGFETCVAEYLESCKNEYGVFFEEGFWINGAASIFENVTHWMPLPEAIEAQEPAND